MTETKPQAGKRKSGSQHAKLAKLLEAGTPVCSALEQAGWSATQAAKGISKVPLAVFDRLSKKAQRLIKLGRDTGKDARRNLVLGRLIENTAKGTDKGALSAKILGSSSDTNMWTPELQQGIVVIGNCPIPITPELLKEPED
jgi:hypothetical protein